MEFTTEASAVKVKSARVAECCADQFRKAFPRFAFSVVPSGERWAIKASDRNLCRSLGFV